jgi:hypothetical protein
MSTTTIDRIVLLKAIEASTQEEIARLTGAAEMATKVRLRKQALVGQEQGVKEAQEKADRFPALIESAYADLKAAVEDRWKNWRGRYHERDSNTGIARATSHLTTLLHGQCEQLATLEAIKTRYEDAKRLEDSITAQQKPEQV